MKVRNQFFTFLAFVFCFFSDAKAAVYNDYGSSGSYSLASGDTLNIRSGKFTGTIASFPTGSFIRVYSSSIFAPASVPQGSNSGMGTLQNYGTVSFGYMLSIFTGWKLDNYGLATFTNRVDMVSGSQQWNNLFSGTLIFKGLVYVNSGAVINNDGSLTFEAAAQFNTGSTLNNRNSIVANSLLTSNSALLNNEGSLLIKGALTTNSGTVFHNKCKTVLEGGYVNYADMRINGLLWLKAHTPELRNHGVLTLTPGSIIKSFDFTNYGDINGSGSLYLLNSTNNIKQGKVGIIGTTTDSIYVFDSTRNSSTRIFDVQNSYVRSNAVYRVLPAPDTINNNMYQGCASAYRTTVVLPFKWISVDARMENNLPQLQWNATFEKEMQFDIQRSYNNRDYTSIAKLPGKEETTYQFQDVHADPSQSVVYYRIKAVSIEGKVYYSEVKAIGGTEKKAIAASISASPNPTYGAVTLNWTSEKNQVLHISVKNLSGQSVITKRATFSSGKNQITLTETERITPGIYVVEISNGQTTLATQKIIKQ